MNNTQLDIGDQAPQFKARDAFGKAVKLSDYNDTFVLLVFLRYAGCPWCNLTLHRLTMEYQMLKDNGCQIIAFVQSDADSIQKNIYHRHAKKPQYTIIPDPERKVYAQYSVRSSISAAMKSVLDIPYWLLAAYGKGFKQTEIDGDMLLVPAMFLVGRDDQKIIRAEYGSSFYDHRTFTDIYEPLIFK